MRKRARSEREKEQESEREDEKVRPHFSIIFKGEAVLRKRDERQRRAFYGKGFFLAGALFFLGSNVFGVMDAAPARAETLQEAMALAYSTSPVLNAQIANRYAMRAAVMRSDARWFPSVTARANYGRTEAESKTETAPSVKAENKSDPWGYDITVSQNIFAGGGDFAASRQARANARAAKHDLRQTVQQVFLDTATSYFNVLRDEAIVSLNERNVSVLRRHLQAVRQRFEVGEITRTDVARSQARLAGAQSRLASARSQLTIARNFYMRVVGIPPENLSFPPLPEIPNNLDESVEYALAQNPSLAARRARTEAARAARANARAAFLPSVDVEAVHRYNGEPALGVNSQSSTSLTGRITIPIFRGFGNYGALRQASYGFSQAQFLERQTLRQINEGVVNSWDTLTAARARILSDTEQQRANRIAYEGVRQEADLGSRTNLEVLDAQQELLNAQVALATSRRQEQVAAYGLLAAMGSLTAGNLGLTADINAWVPEAPRPPQDLRP